MNDHLFAPDFDQPVDPTDQVTRMPGSPNAPCVCPRTGIDRIDQECLWPYCGWKDHQPPEHFPERSPEPS